MNRESHGFKPWEDVNTYHASPLSVPFYEQRMGYQRRSIVFEKRLD